MRHTAAALALCAALGLPAGAAAQTVYKCRVQGALVYQQAPCAQAGQREELREDGFSVIDGPAAPRSTRSTPRPAPSATPPPVRARATRPGSTQADERAERERSDMCVKLLDALARVDARARVRSTSDLTERRRYIKGELWRLRCEGGR